MERIQTAIAKARAARDGTESSRDGTETPQQGRATPRRAAVPRPPVPAEQVREAWAEVPKIELKPQLLRTNRVTAFESGEAAAEFDRLRTRVMQRMRTENWRRIAIVSPGPQNGKSTVAANLSFSLAKQSHLSAMLIELDLRRPSLAGLLGLPPGRDVTRVLAGQGAFPDHAVRLRDNLIAAPAHAMRSGSAEFLQAPATAAALDDLVETYAPSVMVFDMPPMGVGDDVIGFLANTDCALIVAGAGMTSIAEIDVCEREVAERTSVMGVVLNKCRFEPKQNQHDYY